jgi:hypothetical protein
MRFAPPQGPDSRSTHPHLHAFDAAIARLSDELRAQTDKSKAVAPEKLAKATKDIASVRYQGNS